MATRATLGTRRAASLLGRWEGGARSCAAQTLQRRPFSSSVDGPNKGLVGGAASAQSLAQVIDDTIVATGPMSVARYMQMCLTHPTWGYYSQGDVFGTKGDFVTSPEISQIFGELVAIWLLTRWMAAGSPGNIRIVELGPGRGTLMDDVLRTFQALRKFSVDSIHLVENSDKMQGVQRAKLEQRSEQMNARLDWVSDIGSLGESPLFTMIVAHEFFDALPVHLFQRTADGFREIRVDRNPSYLPAANNPRFRLGVDREASLMSSLLPASSSRFMNLPIGSQLEVSPESSRIARRLGELMAEGGGAGLVVDYGGDRSFSNSIRAFQKHKIVDIFSEPGTADLTANVDFAYLKESLDGVAETFGPITQAKFLLSLGLEPRLAKLSDSAQSTEQQQRIRHSAQRLIDNTGMGTQYQVLAFARGKGAEGDVYPFPAQTASTSNAAGSKGSSKGSTA